MLTRFVRVQLTIFTIASVIGVIVMGFAYMQVPTMLGIGKINVTLELPAAGGLYRFSNVTYRGVQMGKVTGLALDGTVAKATLTLDTSPAIPADLLAEVRSVSPVGEQYVDLQPRTDSGPYLRDGSVIPLSNTTIPQAVGPMLDQVSGLINTVPKEKLSVLLDESFKGLNGAGFDLGSLFDSSATLAADLSGVADQTRTLVDDSRPLLDSQADTTDELRTWSRSLANITQTVVSNDQQVRTLLHTGQGAVDEVSALLTQIKPTLPVLLANLTSLGQVLVTYRPSLEQMLVLLPPVVGFTQSLTPTNNPTGLPMGDFAITVGDPSPCTVGFLPPSQWRSPADTTTIDTPDGLYCKLPQDSPIAVRGARNYPCMGHPGKRAPTVEICDSDKPYEPQAMRQHALGPYPFDPNLVAQGIPPDDRVNLGEQIFGPIEGTPMPPGAAAPPEPPGAQPESPVGPQNAPQPPPAFAETSPPHDAGGGVPAAVPSSFAPNTTGSGASVAVAQYNPKTGLYVTPDGYAYRQTDLAEQGSAKSWKDLLPT